MASTSSHPATPRPAARKAPSGRQRREWLTGYLFILPAVALIAVFGLFPIGYALYMSLWRWRVRQGSFIGLQNYENLIGSWWGALAFLGGLLVVLLAHWLWTDAFRSTGRARVGKLLGALVLLGAGLGVVLGWSAMMRSGDVDFLASIVRTVFYALLSIPIQIALALVLAYLLFQNIRGRGLFRMLYFLPYITPVVATAVVFRAIFTQRPEGLANQGLAAFGLAPQRWLFEPRPLLEVLFGAQIERFNAWLAGLGVAWQWEGLWLGPSMALVVLVVFGIWTYTGYNVVIFLAGLGNISKDLYEAAELDGANGAQKFWAITVPLLSPVTFYLTLLGFIGALQAFTQLYVMRQPFVRDAIDTTSVVIFDTFYKANNFSLAAAQSILLFVLILVLTLLQNRLLGRRVFSG